MLCPYEQDYFEKIGEQNRRFVVCKGRETQDGAGRKEWFQLRISICRVIP